MNEAFFNLANLVVTVISLAASAAALWVAWDCRKKTTQHVIRLVECSSGFTRSLHEGDFHRFEIFIKNLGLPIPEMSVALQFSEKDGLSSFSSPMPSLNMITDELSKSAKDVACGVVVRFGWKTNQMQEKDIKFLLLLENLRKQRAVVSVYCAGYRVAVIKPFSLKERLRGVMQSIQFATCKSFRLGMFAKDQKSWRARVGSRSSHRLSFALENFIRSIRTSIPNIKQ